MASVALALAAAVIPGAALAGQVKPGNSFNVCRTDKAIPDGDYEVNNNNFVGHPECLTGEKGTPAFRVSNSGAESTGPGSEAFPDIFTGCSWGMCSPGRRLPARLSALGGLKTTFAGTETAGGTWGAGYEMFFSPRPIRTGQGQVEAMIWLNSRNAYNPAGHWPLVTIDGTKWWVMNWETGYGKKHWRYFQFRRATPVTSVRNLALGPFFAYLERQGLEPQEQVTPAWYLLNLEAGFEIWNGGVGLAVTRFSVDGPARAKTATRLSRAAGRCCRAAPPG